MIPMHSRMRGRWSYVILSFLVALFLMIIPFPDWMSYARPDWLTLVLFYWCLALPSRVGIVTGWFCGVALDILRFSLLGQHALGKAFIALIASLFHRRLRLYHIWQQCIIIFILAMIDHSLVLWIERMNKGITLQAEYWLSVLATALLWPLVYIALRFIRQKGEIT